MASLAAVETELQELKESKKEYTQLVARLQSKIRRLTENTASQIESPKLSLQASNISQEKGRRSRARSPAPLSTSSSRPQSAKSHHSIHPDLPLRSVEEDGDVNNWAREVERVRMLRDETLVELESMKKTRDDLRKSLKESEARLHELERHGKP